MGLRAVLAPLPVNQRNEGRGLLLADSGKVGTVHVCVYVYLYVLCITI